MSSITEVREGVVSPEFLYTVESLKKNLGITESTIREAVRQGLKVNRVHKKRYIKGEEWIRYVCEKGGKGQPPSAV